MNIRFGDCLLDLERFALLRSGEMVRVEPQVFDLLRALARRKGAVATRDELVEEVWKGLNVSDATISARVNAARKAVGDDGSRQSVIATVPRRGFRLVPDVEEDHGAHEPSPKPAGPAREGPPTLAVLPFDYLSAEPDDMLSEGIVDEIIGALSRVHDFRVIARQSSQALGGRRLDIPAAAEALGADYLVEGTVRRSGTRVRTNVDLVAASGVSLWSARYDDTLDQIFDLQDRVAAQVAGQLPVRLRNEEITRARSLHGPSRGARRLVLQAMPHFWAHRREDNRRAVELFGQALEEEPDDVRALAYKAWALVQQSTYMWSQRPAEDREAARSFADAAAGRVEDDPAALVAISAVYAMAIDDGSPALSYARRAIEIDPNNAWGRMRLGWALVYAEKPEAALEEFALARYLSPLDPFMFNMRIGIACAHGRMGALATAIELLKEAITDAPGIPWAYRLLASLQGRAGNRAEATEAGRKLLAAYPGLTMKYLADSVPPTVVHDRDYLKGLRAAGIPEG